MRTSARKPAIVAVDLGAESCRVSLLEEAEGQLHWNLVHRAANGPIHSPAGWIWDFERMLAEVVTGLTQCAPLAPQGIASIGVDGWAVDYVRLLPDRTPTGPPFCYRDERTIAAMAEMHRRISPDRLYSLTGAQHLRINTLYQLYADTVAGIPPTYAWINLPEYMLYRLGGRPVSEFTNATHTQMLGVSSRNWSPEVFAAAGLSLESAPEVVAPGSDVGRLGTELRKLAPFEQTRLIAPACHDTASAVAGIPASGDDWAFISSGTWSLVGTVVDQPYIGEPARAANFTNQGGIGGRIYLLKNVNGMWMLRQCMDAWEEKGTSWSVSDLIDASASLPAPPALLDVDDPELLLPGKMPERINAQLLRKGRAPLAPDPAEAPTVANLIFHSLASRYVEVLNSLSWVTGKQFRRVYVVGGGAKNLRMKRLLEAASGMEVIPGSAESSTVGNFAIQLAAASSNLTSGVDPNAVLHWAGALSNLAAPAHPSNSKTRLQPGKVLQ